MGARLVLNLLLSMAPVFVYQGMIFSRTLQRDSKATHTFVGFVSGVAAVLCMVFPIVHGAHFLWDLRWVPFLLAVIYGGAEGGMICAAMMLLFRGCLGGVLSWSIAAFDAFMLFAFLLWYRKVLFKTVRGRGHLILLNTLLSAGAYLFVMATIFVYFVIEGEATFFMDQGFVFFLMYGIITVTAHNASVLLIENLFTQAAVQQELQQTEKLHIVSELAASFAHEIRNPLTVAKGVLQLLSESTSEGNGRHIQLAQSELNRAEDIISDYLNFAKPQTEKTEPVLVTEQLHEVIRVMSPYAAMHNVIISGDTDLNLRVLCDKKKFKQIMVNLLKNAIEANPDGGRVDIATSTRRHTVVITISDDGVGMDQNQLAMLGKPFYSTKTKGTGLGLMVTFRLVNLMGGKLQFTSSEGTGTTATIHLPLM